VLADGMRGITEGSITGLRRSVEGRIVRRIALT
jgi:hypothetical protein